MRFAAFLFPFWEQQGKERAEYGAEVIKNLALKITPRYGASYNKRNLDYYKRFYLLFPDIQIVNTCVHNLSWSHIRRILSVSDPNNNAALTTYKNITVDSTNRKITESPCRRDKGI